MMHANYHKHNSLTPKTCACSEIDLIHIPGSEYVAACLLRLVLLKLPAKVLVIEASAVGAPQTGQSGQSGQLPSCTDSCDSADRITIHAISLYITAIYRFSTPQPRL